MLFTVHKTLRSSTERLEEHRKENRETEKKGERETENEKKKNNVSLVLW